MKTTRIIAVVLSLMLIACMFAACGSTASENFVTVTVNFEADGEQFYSKEVTVNADEPTVLMAVQQIMDENDDITIVLDDEVEPTTILDVNDYVDSADAFWEFKLNDDDYVDTKGRASTNAIKDGDVITWGYTVDAE